jgi:hypothetical protein
MIVYCVPNAGIHGGVKVAYRFVDALQAAGVAACIATPDGRASQWFRAGAPVLSRADALARMGPDDILMFSLPHDYAELRRGGQRLIFHCQGTDPLIDPIIRDPDVTVLTCWQQAAAYVRETARRESLDVGIDIPQQFQHRGEPKDPHVALHMPGRGLDEARALGRACSELELSTLGGLDETEVALAMRRASVYLATAEGEWFGLPALEAMAAGCLVYSLPTVGGAEYLDDGVNCFVGDLPHLEAAIGRVLQPGHAEEHAAMRSAAIATALGYRSAVQAPKVAAFAATLDEAARQPFRRRLRG